MSVTKAESKKDPAFTFLRGIIMKKTISARPGRRMYALLLAAVLLCPAAMSGCTGDKAPADTAGETKQAARWQDSIEYDSTLSPDGKTVFLYAVSRGKITLWDKNSEKAYPVVLKYDSTADDATDRLETADINGDGYEDIRLVYSESDTGISYNLWLWDADSERYTYCNNYRKIENPESADGGKTVTCHADKGAFGEITQTYTFNDTCGIDLMSSSVDDPDAVAAAICGGLGFGGITASGAPITIGGTKCSLYTAGDKEFLAYTDESVWYASPKDTSEYYEVKYDGGAYSLGEKVEATSK